MLGKHRDAREHNCKVSRILREGEGRETCKPWGGDGDGGGHVSHGGGGGGHVSQGGQKGGTCNPNPNI